MDEKREIGTPAELVTTMSVSEVVEHARQDAAEKKLSVVTNRTNYGKAFLRTITVKGHRYQQLCRHYYDQDGRRRLQVIQHISSKGGPG